VAIRWPGLRFGLEIQVGIWIGRPLLLVLTCDTLGEALEELIEYAPVIGDGGEFRCWHSGQVFIDFQPHLSVRAIRAGRGGDGEHCEN